MAMLRASLKLKRIHALSLAAVHVFLCPIAIGRVQQYAKMMKVRDILKKLNADGWYVKVIRGSHRQLKHPTKPGRVTVAGKPMMKYGQELSTAFLSRRD